MKYSYNNIFQTHKSIAYIKTKPKLVNAVKSWLKHTDTFKYHFYNDEMCDAFMRDVVGGDTYKAYQRLPMKVMKADLWRYCIIYEYGGIYADVDTVCKINPNVFLNDSLLTIVPENRTHLCQWVFSAPPKSPILKEVIDLSVKRILEIEKIKGEHIIHTLTGPEVFTHGIEKWLKKNNGVTYPNNRQMYFNYPNRTYLSVFNDSTFHRHFVCHLYTGQDADGWCQERNKKLM